MADTELKVKITAEDKASSTFSGLSGKLEGLGNAAATAGKVIGGTVVAAIGALGVFAVASFKSAVDAEAEMQQATLALQNSFNDLSQRDVARLKKEMDGGIVSFENLTKSMDKSANAALKLGFDDEEASKAFAKLFSVTKDVTKTQNELKLAMDLSAYSGRSLSDATQALMTVHAGGTKILKEFGIEVNANTNAAQALTLVQDKVTGSAEAMAQTTQGKLKILNESWNNLKETVGQSLNVALQPFMDKLIQFVTSDRFQEWVKKTGEFAEKLAAILFEDIPQGISKAVDAIDNFIEAAKRNVVVIAIWDAIKEAVTLVWDSIKNSLLPALNEFWETLKPFMPVIKEFGEMLAKVFGTILLGALLVTIKVLGGFLALTAEVFAKLIELANWITNIFIKTWENLTNVLSKVIDFFEKIIDLAKKAAEAVSGAMPKMNVGASLNPFSSSFQLPHFAKGGIVTSPTLAMVGEGGEPEAIIPFSKLGGLGSGGMTINIYGDVTGREIVDYVREAIMNDLAINSKLNF